MYLAFKKASAGGWVGKAINLLTIPGIGFCHVAFLFSDGSVWSCRAGHGAAFGERIHHEDFVLMKIKVDSRQEEKIKATCRTYEAAGWGYDYFGVMRFVFPFIPFKWSNRSLFCSEGCITVLQKHHVLDKDRCPAKYINPNILSLIVAADKGLIVNSFGLVRGIHRDEVINV